MRGKAIFAAAGGRADGITPAYAGKSKVRYMPPPPLGDHPRVCGEKHRDAGIYQKIPGSPPRMRGKASGLQKDVW